MNYNISKELKQKIDEIFHSTRRIFHITIDEECFNHQSQFKDIFFSGYGTGILLKFKNSFFLLTAKHVLKDYLTKRPVNTSPFRIQVDATKGFKSVEDFLYPKKIWDIGQLIQENDFYEYEDIILVELHQPMPAQKVKHYINFNNIQIMKVDDFRAGLLSIEHGYSIESNPYYYVPDNKFHPFDANIFSCSTNVKKDFLIGVLEKESNYFFFKKEKSNIKDTNGMSGSLIICVDKKTIKLLGVHVRGSTDSDKIHFVPMEKISNAILEYEKSPSYIIDFCYYERFKAPSKLVSIFEVLPDNLKSRLFLLGSNSFDENEENKIINEMCDFFIENVDFFKSNIVDNEISNFEEFLGIISEIKNTISKKEKIDE